MKYSLQIEINLPREEVIKLFNNADNLKHWQKGLIEFKHIEGEPGKVGSKSAIKYKMGKKIVDMEETITTENLPEEFHGTYTTRGIWNSVENYFEKKGDDLTIWKTNHEFKFESFSMRLMSFLIPGAFKKQSLKFMQDFKNFAENGTSLARNA